MLEQNLTDKQLSISITKIFNWPSEESSNNEFELIFYPEQTDWAPIIEKSIKGTFASNSMIINAYLKISYTDQQKIVVMNMFNLDKLLGQFPIDLEALRDKKVQYFTFGSNQVLQINVYIPSKSTKPLQNQKQTTQNLVIPNTKGSNRNYNQYNNYQQVNMQYDADFSAQLQENTGIQAQRYGYGRSYRIMPNKKQPIYSNNRIVINDEQRSNRSRISYYDDQDTSVRGGRRINRSRQHPNYQYNNNYSRYEQPQPMRKSFSQKVLSLLHQVKVMKDQLSSSRITTTTNNNYGGSVTKNGQRNFMKNKKSMSQTNLLRSNNNKNMGKKHRLILDSLNVVPYEEYYQQNRNANKMSHNIAQSNQNYYYRSNVR